MDENDRDYLFIKYKYGFPTTRETRQIPKWIRQLIDLDACREAVLWAWKYRTPQQAWDECGHTDWMEYLIKVSVNQNTRRKYFDLWEMYEKDTIMEHISPNHWRLLCPKVPYFS